MIEEFLHNPPQREKRVTLYGFSSVCDLMDCGLSEIIGLLEGGKRTLVRVGLLFIILFIILFLFHSRCPYLYKGFSLLWDWLFVCLWLYSFIFFSMEVLVSIYIHMRSGCFDKYIYTNCDKKPNRTIP